ncbi:MAG TPA: GNAT family protein [Rhodanobacter sp.]|nr:GNAT family protein [Rhodanobacter sp.]
MLMSTARLQFDALRPEDAEALFRYRADPVVARYQLWCPASVTAARAFIAAQQGLTLDAPGNWMQYAIRLRADGTLIGDLGVHMPMKREESVEFGITIAPLQQRHGYASEAVRAWFAQVFGHMERHRVHASVDPRNLASLAMLRGLGMRQEAHHRESLWVHGEWVDDVVFALLDREWRVTQAVGVPD